MSKTNALTNRVIDLSTAQSNTSKGIDAAQWRTNVALRMAEQAGVNKDETVKVGKGKKGKYAVVETEIERRTFDLQLVEIAGNGKQKSLDEHRIVGMFGKDMTPKSAAAPELAEA